MGHSRAAKCAPLTAAKLPNSSVPQPDNTHAPPSTQLTGVLTLLSTADPTVAVNAASWGILWNAGIVWRTELGVNPLSVEANVGWRVMSRFAGTAHA
eukprot:365987-Chlamydomonas_euryale.AAC.30